jgi:hypothetical protein
MDNLFFVITPYRYAGTWGFDDPEVDLVREPFVSGGPEIIDELVEKIPDAREGFRMIFSAGSSPGFKRELKWVRAEYDSHW